MTRTIVLQILEMLTSIYFSSGYVTRLHFPLALSLREAKWLLHVNGIRVVMGIISGYMVKILILSPHLRVWSTRPSEYPWHFLEMAEAPHGKSCFCPIRMMQNEFPPKFQIPPTPTPSDLHWLCYKWEFY